MKKSQLTLPLCCTILALASLSTLSSLPSSAQTSNPNNSNNKGNASNKEGKVHTATVDQERLEAVKKKSPLLEHVMCIKNGGYKPVEVLRIDEGAQFRLVETSQGEKKISTKDGFRITLANEKNALFLKVRVEESAPQLAKTDKETVRQFMQDYAKKNVKKGVVLKKEKLANLEILSLNQPYLKEHGPISVISLLNAKNNLITTAYFLEQANQNPAFQDMKGFQFLKDDAMQMLKDCSQGK